MRGDEMPIKNAVWSANRGLDLHVLKGQSTPDLSARHISFTKMNGQTVWARDYLNDANNHNDVSLVFTPLIKSAPDGDLLKGGGVEVNTKTGVVKAVDPLPNPHLRNFILRGEITNTADAKKYTLSIRIHVHESVTSFWLTPDILTIRPNGTKRPDDTRYKFTARAQFDDGTLGDLTENHQITWTPDDLFSVRRQIVLRAGDKPGDPPITVTAKLPAALGGASATAPVRVAEPWGDPTPATIVVGGGWPGTINPAVVPNVLFLADGFTDAPKDRDSFERLSNSFVHRMKTNHVTAPFDRLATSMNFWRAFIPSKVRGISVLCEVYTLLQGGELRAYMVNNPAEPPAAGAWALGNVVYAAGLPVAADHDSNHARTNADIKSDWAALLNPDPSPNVPDVLLNQWRRLGNRTFLEEKDTPLCMAYGKPPQVDQETDTLFIDFHFRRMRRQRDPDNEDQSRFDLLLGSLAGERGIDLSGIWAEKARVRPTNYDFVFILSHCKWDRGRNYTGYIAMNVSEQPYLTGLTAIAGKNALLWNPPDPPVSVPEVRGGRATHEIAHSFGLGDEYANQDDAYTGTADDLKPYGNLQLEADARSGGDISGNEIKWNWVRARKGALLRAPLEPAGPNRWKVKVRLGHGSQFAKDDVLILRKRDYPRPLGKRPQESSMLTVAEPPTPDQVIVTGAIAPLLTFGEGDVLYLPTPAPASVKSPTYPFAEMVGFNVKKLITDGKQPLSAVPCSPAQSRSDVQVPALGALVTPLKAADLPHIVGLYYGGRQKSCGIFHPAGTCIMHGSALQVLGFCAVCRYVLTEVIDPFKHFENDLDYDRVYPQP
jgi:hypothetical protein